MLAIKAIRKLNYEGNFGTYKAKFSNLNCLACFKGSHEKLQALEGLPEKLREYLRDMREDLPTWKWWEVLSEKVKRYEVYVAKETIYKESASGNNRKDTRGKNGKGNRSKDDNKPTQDSNNGEGQQPKGKGKNRPKKAERVPKEE